MILKKSHHALDKPLIVHARDTFIDMAKNGYRDLGRGAVCYRYKEDDASYIPQHVWEKESSDDTAELRRMMRKYEPESQFVLATLHEDGTVGIYQFAFPTKR